MAEPSRNPSTLDPTHSDLALTPQSSGTEFAIESYANELMDELFWRSRAIATTGCDPPHRTRGSDPTCCRNSPADAA
ncbi:MAG: hypothetical protein HC881_16040, partial [Leptolyngbyaceae cyanobacterium SL_7_1]|nr:hypothetical protein [Leptolyngbyaceae cyanobacterium SL_7_1]